MSDATKLAQRITPGRWESAKHGTTPGNTSVEVQTETGLPVAVMSYCGAAEANAELIALAPTLLAQRDTERALVEEASRTIAELHKQVSKLRAALLSLMHATAPPNKPKRIEQAHQQARAAIALAGGGK